MKRGLVLAGGGAKGAYAFGCIKALLKEGVHFDVVAGTSVGALNAALLAMRAMKRGEKIWLDMAPSKVYPVKPIKACRSPIWSKLTPLLRFPAIMVGLGVSAITGVRTPLERVMRFLASVAFLFPPLIIVAWMRGFEEAIDLAIFLVSLLALMVFLPVRRHRFGVWLNVFGIPCFLYALIMLQAISWAYDLIIPEWLTAFWQSRDPPLQLLIGLGLSAGHIVVAWFAALGILSVLRKAGVRLQATIGSYMSNSPLADTIRGLLDEHDIGMPCFVTIAQNRKCWDPDYSGWYKVELYATGLPSPNTPIECYPRTQHIWTGRYINIRDCTKDEAAAALLASAALPFGLVPPVRIGSETFVDGGVYDNVPTFSMMECGLDELWVILLEPIPDGADPLVVIGADPDTWRERERSLRVARYPIPDMRYGTFRNPPEARKLARTSPPLVLPYAQYPRLPKRVHIIAPKPLRRGRLCTFLGCSHNPLGGFLSGTLNFRSHYAERIMQVGYEDAMRAIENSRGTYATHSSDTVAR